jgi:hypothetical protein
MESSNGFKPFLVAASATGWVNVVAGVPARLIGVVFPPQQARTPVATQANHESHSLAGELLDD